MHSNANYNPFNYHTLHPDHAIGHPAPRSILHNPLLADIPPVPHNVQGRDVEDLLKEEAPKPNKQIPMLLNIRLISLSEPTLKAQVGERDR